MLEEKIKTSKSKEVTNYIDLNFPPKKQSIYELTIDSPFDIYVHWRRPQEIYVKDQKLDAWTPDVF